MTTNKYLKKISNIGFVKGYNRGIIYDFARNNFEYVPNSLIDFVEAYDKKIISREVYKKYEDYIFFLISKDFIIFCDEKDVELFDEMALDWDYPGYISNSLIEIPEDLTPSFFRILNFLTRVGCEHYVFYSYKEVSFQNIQDIIEYCHEKLFTSISFYVTYSEGQLNNFIELTERHLNIQNIILFNADSSGFVKMGTQGLGYIVKSLQSLSFNYYDIDFSIFNLNLIHYTESIDHNVYFNRKISIDKLGNIRNAPNLDQVFGNIDEINYEVFKEVITSDHFKFFWNSNKDRCDICKLCEYRYMCTDNRIPTKRDNGSWHINNMECNYNPYISKWKGEDGYVSVFDLGSVDEAFNFVENTDLIKSINYKLWGD